MLEFIYCGYVIRLYLLFLRDYQRNGLQLWRLAANILNKQSRTENKGWSSSLGVGLTTLHHKNKLVTKNLTKPRTWTDSLDKRPKLLVESSCEFGIEPSGSMKCWETIEWPSI
jgi:hypothetical protein